MFLTEILNTFYTWFWMVTFYRNNMVNLTVFSNYIKKLSNKNIREAIIYTNESREVAQKYFNKIKKSPKEYLDGYTKNLDNFDKWYSEVFQSNLFEAHHIIPKQVLDNADLKKILDWARKNNKSWDFGGLNNGVMLQKIKKNISGEIVGDHANHPNYNTLINNKISNEIFDPSDLEGSFKELMEFTNKLKQKLNQEVIEGENIVSNLIII